MSSNSVSEYFYNFKPRILNKNYIEFMGGDR